MLFHVDAAQSVGKLPLDLADAPIDLCSLTAHKLCGPKGVGALYVAPRATLVPQLHGGEQERSLRPARWRLIRSSAWARPTSSPTPRSEAPRLAALRDRAVAGARDDRAARARTATPARRAAHVLNATFPGVDGESLRFELRDVAVSAGSACAADSPEASHVLTGMGLSDVAGRRARCASAWAGSRPRTRSWRLPARVAAAVARLRALAKRRSGVVLGLTFFG